MSERYDYAFLHGGIQGGWVWQETLTALAGQTNHAFGSALILDIPGCGTKRGRPTDDIGPEEVARELLADVEAAGIKEVVLVGHSQAGTILPLMLEMRPRLFRRAIYVSCIAPPTGETVLEFGRTLREGPVKDVQPDLAALFCNDMSSSDAASFLSRLGADQWPRRTYSESSWRYSHVGETPASYIYCLRDATVPLRIQEECARRLGASRSVRIDAGHQVMNTRPHALAESLRREAAAEG
jgi:pimeloyl-ACP methyl ester carboxylesterase